jgi:hypothetical protein
VGRGKGRIRRRKHPLPLLRGKGSPDRRSRVIIHTLQFKKLTINTLLIN